MDISDAANTFTSMLHAIDARNWDGVRLAFAEHVDIDYSSLTGGPAATVDIDGHVAGWREFALGFDATQHVTGPIIVTPNEAGVSANTHVRAYHYVEGAPGNEVWMVAGHYDVRLRATVNAWEIVAITLTVFYQEGNLALPERARSRAASSPTQPRP
jgi:hypothetical protein